MNHISFLLQLYGYSTSFFMKHVLTYCIEPGLVYFSKLRVIKVNWLCALAAINYSRTKPVLDK